jgi:hypothetical protein
LKLFFVARAYRIPVFVTRDWFAEHPYLESTLGRDDIVLDHTVTIDPAVPPEKSYKRECPEKTAPRRLDADLFSAFSPTE